MAITTAESKRDARVTAGRRLSLVRIVTLVFAGIALVVLTGCDPSADFVVGGWDNGGHRFVIDASSGPSGENAQGTLKFEGQLFGTVGCLQITASEARVGLDLSPSLGLTALAVVTDREPPRVTSMPAPDAFRARCLRRSAGPLEPGPAQPGNFLVGDLVPK